MSVREMTHHMTSFDLEFFLPSLDEGDKKKSFDQRHSCQKLLSLN